LYGGNKLKRIIFVVVLLMLLTSCAKEEIVDIKEIPSEIKPAPETELPEPLEPSESEEETAEEEEVEEEPEEEAETLEEPETDEDKKVVYIEIMKYEFVPSELTIEKGTTVIWENVDDTAHIFKQVGTGFRSPIIKDGETFEHTFNESEVFSYTEFNFGARGKIVVE